MTERSHAEADREPLASIIITTYNRKEALLETLEAIGRQTVDPARYEVIVVDDGSTDGTYEAASSLKLPCALRVLRHSQNRGIPAGRNTAIRVATGRYLILLSDDLIVPGDFIEIHVRTLEAYPRRWVVGGYRQHELALRSSFGRYLDHLENSWRKSSEGTEIEANVWEVPWPTARNLSLPRADLDRTGLFDEQFRMVCEDQDLAHEAMKCGIGFLYNANITSLHNEQVLEFGRYCRSHARKAIDTVLFCSKWSEHHAKAPVVRLNGPITDSDSAGVALKKVIKSFLALRPVCAVADGFVALLERCHAPDAILWPIYRAVIGIHIFKTWRAALKTLGREGHAIRLGDYSHV